MWGIPWMGAVRGGLGSVAIKAPSEPPQKPQSPVAITVAIGRSRYSENLGVGFAKTSGGAKGGVRKKWSRQQLKERPVSSPEIEIAGERVSEREWC